MLTACGGGSTETAAVVANPTPARGTLLQNPPGLVTVTAPNLLLKIGASVDRQLLALAGTPLCDIAVFHIRYQTVGGAAEPTTASGALMVPTGADARCRGALPIVLYAHGTTTNRAFNIADLNDSANAEGLYVAAFFAARGYIVVAPNYAGYDTSTLGYHAYLNADQQSKDMIDALTAARTALATPVVPLTSDGRRLYVTGYSQGGYVAMATHRAMQAAGMAVTASAPMSGPYAMAAFVDQVFAGRVVAGAPVVSTLLLASYQKSYGDIYAASTDIFTAQYATGIESLLPSTIARGELYAQGKLPQNALFSATAPDPAFAAVTPATTPVSLASVYARGFGAAHLITNAYRLRYLRDAETNPDGGWPVASTGIPAASPALALRQALRRNDLRTWSPAAPTLLCGGSADPSVSWTNTQLMASYWSANPTPALSFRLLDVDSGATVNDPYASLKRSFATARDLVAAVAVAQGATDRGASAVSDAYHATLVAPICLSAVREFFATQ